VLLLRHHWPGVYPDLISFSVRVPKPTSPVFLVCVGFLFFVDVFGEGTRWLSRRTEIKETKAQRIERLKRTKNAWDALDEIRAFAKSGYETIPPEWFSTYFRTWGVYSQGDGAGVTGGKNGEGKATPFFMLRIRIPNGQLRSDQGAHHRWFGGKACEGRGGYQPCGRTCSFHWVTIESLPEVLETLWSVD